MTITKAPLEVSVGNYTRKQGEDNPQFILSYDGFKNGETEEVLTSKPSASTTATISSEPGEYDIVLGGGEAENYDISYTNGTLTITDADPVTVTAKKTVTAKNYTREYGDANPEFGYTVSGAALVGEPEIICEATATSPVGEYPIIIKKGSVKNFNDSYVHGVLTITKAPLIISVGNYTKKQGEKNPEFEISYNGFKNNDTEYIMDVEPIITTNATETSEPGEYEITVSGAEAENYEISYVNGLLTITDADSVIVLAKSYTREYGEANPGFEYTVEGAALDGTPEIICEATTESPVGEYTITIKKGSVKNYNDTYISGTLTITKAPLTVSVGSYTRRPGEENPEFELIYSGWKLDDDESVLIEKPIAFTQATQDSSDGEYTIFISGGDAENYYFEYVEGVLTITGIAEIMADRNVAGIYSIDGKRLSRPQRGLNIIRMKDGTVKRVMVK